MAKKRSKWWIGLLVLVTLGVLAASTVHFWEYLPYQSTVAKQFKNTLKSYGLEVVSLDLDRLNQSEMDLSNIQLGTAPGLAIGEVNISYFLPQITQLDTLKLYEVNADNIKAHMYIKDNTLMVSGLEPLRENPSGSSATLDIVALQKMLPQTAGLHNVTLSGKDTAWSFNTIFNADLTTEPSPVFHAVSKKVDVAAAGYQLTVDDVSAKAKLNTDAEQKPLINIHAGGKKLTAIGNDQELIADGLDVTATLNEAMQPTMHAVVRSMNARAGKYHITSGKADVNAAPSNKKKQWDGKLSIQNVVVTGLDTPIPVMQLTADFTLKPDSIKVTIRASDKGKAHQARIVVVLPLAAPDKGTLAIEQLHFPWGGGVISLKPLTIPLAFNTPLPLAIQLEKVQLSQLLATLGEGKISGTGNISGLLPITYHQDGTVTLQAGKADALEAGTISVSPYLLPGDNQELAVARTALENFHYTKLGISISSDKEEKSTIHLTLEGNNPDAFDGRQVNLNVNLTGDVLPLIQQSVLPINNLKELLKLQGKP